LASRAQWTGKAAIAYSQGGRLIATPEFIDYMRREFLALQASEAGGTTASLALPLPSYARAASSAPVASYGAPVAALGLPGATYSAEAETALPAPSYGALAPMSIPTPEY
jgi:hypothetical protein